MDIIRSTLTGLCDAFNAHDLDLIMEYFSDDCVLEMPRGTERWGSRFEGKPNVRKAISTRFDGLPDVHYGNAEHFVDAVRDLQMDPHGNHARGEARGGARL
ncbi:YybH family protein [Aminobacter anthyllidis]|uniref:YybH family protein n=1 Tax=Aminobacter anthyllidis TaxID=1035067 RepID=UPI001FE648B2|nr:nuclear transport factor 2 family protein [Aminobacter anthyllidis]